MASPASFAASPNKRIAAFVYDAFAVFFGFLALAVLAESLGHDLATWPVFVLCALAYHTGFLALRDGRTLGKAAQDLCVIGANGQPLRAWQACARPALRYLPLLLLAVPVRDWVLAEALAGLAFKVLASLVWLAECARLHGPPPRQTHADRLARSLVVHLPTWEPHRAPAVPMFSAHDAEFGQPPRRPPPHVRPPRD